MSGAPTVATFDPAAPTRTDAVPLVCFPYAGGDSRAYRSWSGLLPAGLSVHPARLPGRERRWDEPVPALLTDLAMTVAADVSIAFPGRYVLFGHSMGALLAFEVARVLSRLDRPPAALVVSGCPPPGSVARTRRFTGLTDEELGEWLRTGGGVPAEVLADPALRAYVLPIVRADLKLFEGYRYQPRTPLTCPVVYYGATPDGTPDERVVAGWREQTSGPFETRTFAGNHFWFTDCPELFAADLAGRVDRLVGPINRDM
ncbi:thioesterase II family protein [Micromonospora echinofusca]|uniref:Alpha/beta fold hydrolase n=1 Tax=Micromonospora echinofusca TaxID=47858 RepID=A0ABS3VXW4_MICEH|nr:alpha/beta fold hydrolase [Micromonospora echinofusca]MBO4209382.1 alpha/beta fold hydrolase [Micromonospora echinofusca]